jgi:hypothetical protein
MDESRGGPLFLPSCHSCVRTVPANWREGSRTGYVCLGFGAARVILAMPVAPAQAVEMLRAECDEVVCLATPEDFMAVGMHYEDFHQVDDNELAGTSATGANIGVIQFFARCSKALAGIGTTAPAVGFI